MRVIRLLAALVVGCASAIGIAVVAFSLLRWAWPEYGAAEPDKAFTLGMMLARLSIAALLVVGAALVATIVAGDRGRAAICLGSVFVLVSLPSHLYYSWADYPVGYHAWYLTTLVPLAWLGGKLAHRVRSGVTRPPNTALQPTSAP